MYDIVWMEEIGKLQVSRSFAYFKIGSSDIGLVFAGSSLSPDLRIKTLAILFSSMKVEKYSK